MKYVLTFLLVVLTAPRLVAQEGEELRSIVPPGSLNKNAIKFDPIRMLVGEIAFSYERRLTPNISAEVAAGPTISNVNHVIYGFGTQHPNDDLEETRWGGFFNVAGRYYLLQSAAMRKCYIAPKFRWSRFNTFSTDNSELITRATYQNTFSSLLLGLGWQAWYSQQFALDYYIGAGYSWNTYNTSYDFSKYSGEQVGGYYLTEKQTTFVYEVGIKCTIGF